MEKLKKLSEIPSATYFSELGSWMIQYGGDYLNDRNNHANSRDDFDRPHNMQTDRTHLVEYGEMLIVDLEDDVTGKSGAYFVVQLTKRKYKAANGRLIPFKIISRLCDTRAIDHWRSGYFLVPLI